jgi:lysophospholipase L1-like esterase
MRIMGSVIRAPYDIEKLALEIALRKPRFNDTVPERFINYLNDYRERRGTRNKDGIAKRNPLIVALGDSVTQGCFEGNLNYTQQMMDEFYPGGERIPNVIDTVNVYHEKFRCMLAEKYNAPASVINSGIGGDTVIHMLKRLERDVLRYSPHLVLLNASLNGPAGDLETYEKHFRAIVDGILENTDAEIILITPNMMVESWMRDLESRANIIREIGSEKNLCIADAYAIWEEMKAAGIDIGTLLSNRINHPVIVGHEIFAIELMKLFE